MEYMEGVVSDKLKKILQAILIILFIVFGIYRILQARTQHEINLTYALEKYANDMNGECPISVGTTNGLVIRSVKFKDMKTVIYDYKFLNYQKEYFDLQKLKKNLSKTVIEELESLESLAKLRNKDVIFEYYFYDNLDIELVRLKVLFNTPITFLD